LTEPNRSHHECFLKASLRVADAQHKLKH